MRQLRGDGFDVYRVIYNPHDRHDTPRRAEIAGGVVKLGSLRSQDSGVITLVDGSGRNRVRVTAIMSAGVQ